VTFPRAPPTASKYAHSGVGSASSHRAARNRGGPYPARFRAQDDDADAARDEDATHATHATTTARRRRARDGIPRDGIRASRGDGDDATRLRARRRRLATKP